MARAAKLDLRAFQQELAARLAAKTTQQVEQARLVLFGPRVGELRAGLVVTRVLGLSNLAELVRSDADAGAPAWYGARWTDKAGGVWQEIDLALLAQDPAFLQVGL